MRKEQSTHKDLTILKKRPQGRLQYNPMYPSQQQPERSVRAVWEKEGGNQRGSKTLITPIEGSNGRNDVSRRFDHVSGILLVESE